MSQQIEAGSQNPEHEMIQEMRFLLAKMEKMSIEDLNALRIHASIQWIPAGEQLLRLATVFSDRSFITRHLHNQTMFAKYYGCDSKFEMVFFYAFGLLDGEDVLTSTSHEDPRQFSIESIRVSETV